MATGKNQLNIVYSTSHSTFTTESLKESLSAVCPMLGVHNVARVRQGASLALVEVDFTDEKALERFCKSISDGIIFYEHW